MVRKKKGDQSTEQASEATATESQTEAFEIVPEDPLEIERSRNEDLVERLKRQQADFENYKKRTESRYAEFTRFAGEGILLKVVDVLDDLDRALQSDSAKDAEATMKGIAGIRANLAKMLSQEGVQLIDSVGRPFDSYYQHAVQCTYDPNKPDNIVVKEYKRGYMLKEKVLRPALVCVNKHETPVEAEKESEDREGISKAGDE
jgi:molecular chaperone GrpE